MAIESNEILVSVIIPTYNRAQLISDTIDSVYNALSILSKPFEIIVVDDCSLDDTFELVSQKYSFVRIEKLLNNCGAPKARNTGLALCQGKYVLFIDSDDIVEFDFFSSKVKTLENNLEIDGVAGPFSRYDYSLQTKTSHNSLFSRSEKLESSEVFANLLEGKYLPIHTILWRTESILLRGGFDERLTINQDVQFLFNQLIKGGKLAYELSGTAIIRDHQEERQGTINTADKLNEILKLRMKFVAQLQQNNLWKSHYREKLATFCFNYWIKYRKRYPIVSKQFLNYQRELAPYYKLNARLPLRLLGYLIGAHNALIARESLQRILKL